jgi:hypothetical protein
VSSFPLPKNSVLFTFMKKAPQSKAGHPCFYIQDDAGTYWPVAYIRPSRSVPEELFKKLVDDLAERIVALPPRRP